MKDEVPFVRRRNHETPSAANAATKGFETAIRHAWTEGVQELWAGVLNFWFLGRVFDRVR